MSTYTYLPDGQRASYNLSQNGTTILSENYTYNILGLLSSVSEGGSSRAAYTYDPNGKLLTETLRNGSVTTDTTTYSYNAMGLPNTEAHSSGASFNYAYYADGTLNTKSGDGKTVSYTYDAGGRLTSETERAGNAVSYSAAYTYDARGNRAKLTVGGSESYSTLYAYDANNQLQTETKTQGSKVDTTKYFYDPNGSQITKITSTTAGSSGTSSVALVLGVPDDGLSVYDGLNRLVQVIGRTGTISYTYRPDGLRASKTAGGVVTNTLWDLTDVAAEVGGTGTTTYLRGAGLIAAKSSGAYVYYDKNAHGDVYRLLNSSGTVTLTYVYDAFGVQRTPDPKATTADANPFRYCGEYWDSETGNYYLRARYYAPGIGRFTQMDPARSGSNLYVYCGSNPILNKDPSGRRFPTNDAETALYPQALQRQKTMATIRQIASMAQHVLLGIIGIPMTGTARPSPSVAPQRITTVDSAGLNLIANMERGLSNINYDKTTGAILGIPTLYPDVGYGHDVRQNSLNPVPDSLTAAEALALLKQDVADAEKRINSDVSVNLTQDQFNALVSLRYNIGALGNVNGLLDYLNGGSYDRATLGKIINSFYDQKIAAHPSQEQYREGWYSRTNDMLNVFFDGNYGYMPIDAVNGRVILN